MTLGALTYNIKIGQRTLKGLTALNLKTSIEQLSDIATIELPAYINNSTYDIESKVKRGMPVEIWLGYEGKNVLEFKGFVRGVSVNSPCLIDLEDEMFAFRKEVKSQVFIKKNVTDILKVIAAQIGYKVDSKVDALVYDKLVINQATGYEVLQEIQERFKIAIYVYNGILYANYTFMERRGVEYLSFQGNIQASSLKYVKADENKVKVTIKGVGSDNKATRTITAGESGGEVINLPDRLNVTDEKALKLIANEELKKRSYTGFRGTVTTWGIKQIKPGFVVSVKDEDYKDHDGYYFVKAVEVNFSRNGFERIIELAERLS